MSSSMEGENLVSKPNGDSKGQETTVLIAWSLEATNAGTTVQASAAILVALAKPGVS